MRTQVVVTGVGLSGMLLGQLPHVRGTDCVVLERRTKAHVLSRVRAGILETGFCALMREAGVGARMDTEGLVHDGTVISHNDQKFGINFRTLIGQT